MSVSNPTAIANDLHKEIKKLLNAVEADLSNISTSDDEIGIKIANLTAMKIVPMKDLGVLLMRLDRIRKKRAAVAEAAAARIAAARWKRSRG